MWTIIEQVVQGLISGVFQPLMGYLGKRTDDELAGFQTGAGMDAATYATYVQGFVQIQALKAQQLRSPFAAAVGDIAGYLSLIYFGAILLDSVCHLDLRVSAMPSGWDEEAKIILGSFLILSPRSPVGAAAAWLHRK